MRRNLTMFLGTLALAVVAVPAYAATYSLSTANHPLPSSVVLGIWAGVPGDPDSVLFAEIGPIGVTGTMTADINTPGGNGTINITSASLLLANYTEFQVPLAALGAVDISATGVGVNFSGGPSNVANNVVTLPSGTLLTVGINSGVLSLTNPTGILATLLPGGYFIDLDAEPISTVTSFDTDIELGTTDEDGGLDAPTAEFNFTSILSVPAADLAGIPLYAALNANVHFAAAIPEPSSFALAGMGLVGLVLAGRRFRRS